ncbi:MAG: 2-oxo acid dehydrogenase subunit E2 [Acidimicrobiales bacterium]
MPQLGETVTEGTITRWFKQVGETIAVDEVLFEVSTDKVDTEVPSIAGTITEIRDPKVTPSTSAPSSPSSATVPQHRLRLPRRPHRLQRPRLPLLRRLPSRAPASPVAEASPSSSARQHLAPAPAPVACRRCARSGGRRRHPSGPLAGRASPHQRVQPRRQSDHRHRPRRSDQPRRRAAPHRGDQGTLPVRRQPPARVAARPVGPAGGSGSRGRSAAAPPRHRLLPAPAPVPPLPAGTGRPGRPSDTVVPLTNIRLRTGEHMVMSKAVAPNSTAIEVDYENVDQVRKAHRRGRSRNEGFSLTYPPFKSATAIIDAPEYFPTSTHRSAMVELIVHQDINMGIAVDLDFQGLRLRSCGRPTASGHAIARDISDVARRARSKQLSPDDLQGGTFTITNAGSYGTMMQFPIINQPQVAIMSTDAVKRKPVVIEDAFGNESIGIHSVGVLAMAWDHRAIDGAYAAAFLARVSEIIETRDWAAELA